MMAHSVDQTSPWPELRCSLPAWINEVVPADLSPLGSIEERMRFVIRLAEENVRRGTGGPFGAAVFEMESGRLVAPGVNLVVGSHWSGAHAEMVACALAQQVFASHDLGEEGHPECELVTSVEPCAMCLGSVPWSGVHRVVYGARESDARSIGFDEGHKPRDWQQLLRLDGIQVIPDVLRIEAIGVLKEYAHSGGVIYNGRAHTRRRGTSS